MISVIEKYLCLIVVFIFVGFTTDASELNYRLKRIKLSDGLSHTDVLAIAQDSLGFIWLGTFNGLDRYDGNIIRSFQNNDTSKSAIQNRIYDLTISPDHKIWLATGSGASLFDMKKERFVPNSEIVNQSDVKILNRTPFLKVCIDSKQRVWFLNSETILVLDKSDIKNPQILSFSNVDKQLGVYDKLNFNDISEDRFGNMWVATSNGLIQLSLCGDRIIYRGKYFDFVKGRLGWKNYINDIYLNHDGDLVYSNSDFILLHKLTLGKEGITNISMQSEIKMSSIVFDDKKIFEYSYISSITQPQHKGDYWFFSNGFIHHAFDKNQLHSPDILYNSANMHEDYNLNSLIVPDLLVDRSECLFIGTYENNLLVLDLNQKPFNWISRKTVKGTYFPKGRAIRSIYDDDDDYLWFCSTNGIAIFNKKNGSIENFYEQNNVANLPKKLIYALAGNNDGKIWIGTNMGIEIFDKKKRSIAYITNEQLINKNINADTYTTFDFDKFGRAWIGSTIGGIVVVDYKSESNINLYAINNNSGEKLTAQKINFILCDNAVNEVYATTDLGFNRIILDEKGAVKKIIKYRGENGDLNSISSNMIYPIAKYNDSIYYLGTLGGGLNKVVINNQIVDDKGFGYCKSTAYKMSSGLPSNDIEGLIIDEKKRIWCSGAGISVFDPINNTIKNYNSDDGIQVEAFKVNTFCKGKNNVLYFGGVDGITYFDPGKIYPNTVKTNVIITDFLINGIKVNPSSQKGAVLSDNISYTRHISLNYLQNDFTLYFASMHYANPQNNRYRYKLEGIDKEWKLTPIRENKVQYSNLPFGTYEFEVYGSNNDGVWFDSPAVITITISPPWYQSKLAYIAYLIVVMSILMFIYYNQYRLYEVRHKLKLNHLEEIKKEELLNTKLQFFTNISHEFRTPLTFIISPLLDIKSKSTNRETKYSLDLALKYANRLLRLIDQLIQFRKTESGLDKLNLGFHDINDLVRNTASLFSKPAENSEIALTIELFDSNINSWIDAVKLETILYNLLSNAFKSLTDKRVVTIRTFLGADTKLPIDERKNRHEIISDKFDEASFSILVSDTGIGISKESLPEIFERFYNINSEKHVGYGIGLALLKNLVMLMNGKIEIASARGLGTDFLISFPKLAPTENDLHQNEAQLSHGQSMPTKTVLFEEEVNDNTFENINIDSVDKRTILIVEDNHELRNYLNVKLSGSYKIVEAAHGKEGLKMALEYSPDLIISDIMMPYIDGFELCSILKDKFETCHIPIILLTAKSEIEDRFKGIENGADDYISKPFSIEYLSIKIKTVLANRDKLLSRNANESVLNVKKLTIEKTQVAFVDKVIEIVKNRMCEPDFCIEYIYNEMGLSRSLFFAKVKEATHQTPADFIKQVRLKLGIQYLINNQRRINEAASHIGMTASNFTREFKRVFKKTPSEYLDEIGM